jgi:osmoprotectant transport system permease protein
MITCWKRRQRHRQSAWLPVFVFSLCSLCLCGSFSPTFAAEPEVVVGSKTFTESVILGELIAHLARSAGARVKHREGLGGTKVLWSALLQGEIDIYAEYTGTISQEILAGQGVQGEESLRRVLADRYGVRMSRPLGFNNTYALGMKEELAAKLGLEKISDLRRYPELRFGFSNEFMDRGDGWPSLRDRYQLPQKNVRGLEHTLAYRGLESGSIDATDIYSTDADIRYYKLRLLDDDLRHFPKYYAVLLYRDSWARRNEAVEKAVLQLEGRVSREAILEMNWRAKPRGEERVPESRVAAAFLKEHPFFNMESAETAALAAEKSAAGEIVEATGEHLLLVAISLATAIIVAIPLGIFAARQPLVGQAVLSIVGLIQTIPSLALLVFLIPLLGLGTKPAIMALFLYSLLPIVRNTYAGLNDIPIQINESAEALGLPRMARLWLVELPLATRSILAGIKTSAVINVGTATLGGIIGAGGYGQIILKGIRLDNIPMILQGAIPAALLALLVQALFELAERWAVPKGLQLRPEA